MYSPAKRIALKDEDIVAIVQNELEYHPHLAWEDVYKLLNQAWYGPTHITRDRDLVITGISNEYKAMKQGYLPIVQDIGNAKGYMRLSLSFIDLLASVPDRAVPKRTHKSEARLISEFTDIVLASCLPKDPGHQRWIDDFTRVMQMLEDTHVLKLTQTDLWHKELMASGEMPSHSAQYKEKYGPHYRVVHYKTLYTYLHDNDLVEVNLE